VRTQLIVQRRGLLPLRPVAFLLLGIALLGALPGRAQVPVSGDIRPQELVPIRFTVSRVGSTELTSIQREGVVYLPLGGMFTFLRIRHDYNPAARSITGFYITRDTLYTIDLVSRRAEIGPRLESISDAEYIIADGDVFFRPDFYERVFGLKVEYRERTVSANLSTNVQLPVFRERRLDRLENQLRSRRVAMEPEVTIPRGLTFLDGFRADWAVSQNLSADRGPTRLLSSRIGLHVLGGDLLSTFNARFARTSELYYSRHLWRLVPSRQGIVRGILVGDQSAGGLYMREYYGVTITNAPLYQRYFFAEERLPALDYGNRTTYMFSGGQLTDVARANGDTSAPAAYDLGVPLRFGSNVMDMRAYDTWGDEALRDYRILVPLGMVPPGQLDYSVTAGRMRDPLHPYYGSVSTLWGVSTRVTLGGRAEYFGHRDLPANIYPALFGTFRFAHSVAGEALVAPGAYSRGTLVAEFPWLLNLSAIFTKYSTETRLFNPRRADYDFDLAGSMPFWVGSVRSGLALGFTQTVLPANRERILRAAFDMNIGFFSPRVSFYSGWNHNYSRDVTNVVIQQSVLAARFRLAATAYFALSTTFDHLQEEFDNIRGFLVVSPVRDLRLEFTYERSFTADASLMRFDLRYFFPFMKVDIGVVRSRDRTAWAQRAAGFIGFASPGATFIADNRARAGFGSALVRPFVDANDNNVMDDDELPVTSAKMTWASEEYAARANTRRVDDLGWGILNTVPYRLYNLEFTKDAFENPLWVAPYRSFRLTAEPGRYRVVDIPLKVGGIIRGRVFATDPENGTDRTTVPNVRLVLRSTAWRNEIPAGEPLPFEATVATFTDGSFEFAAVPPGEYDLSLVISDLARAGLATDARPVPVSVVSRPEGSVLEGVEFVVKRVF
jgi:hypothetical protein